VKCAQAQEWICEKLEGTRAAQLDLHLQDCSECRAMRESWQLLGGLPELEPSPLFQARVWEKIRQQPRTTTRSWRRWLGGLGLAAAGLALCMNLLPPAPLATPTLPPPVEKELAQNLAAGELQEWDTNFEVVPGLEVAAADESPVAVLPLGDLSHDYFAVDDTLEDPPL
jgi:hypothetical protein